MFYTSLNSACFVVISGAGGVISSARDIASATWLQTLLLLGKNPVTNEQVIPASVIQKVATGITHINDDTKTLIQVLVSSASELGPVVYGGGQMAVTYRGHTCVYFSGFNTQITRFPFDNFGIAVLSNDDAYGDQFTEVIKWRLIDALLGLEPIDWNTRCEISGLLFELRTDYL
ncbi:hypothetical protein BDP27DRAFT_1220279 [Rhodocollybia butyracea]|uniref:Beta-lactamase-related domain-containing protein n=1 Tax=Rhodocollybia butyracea TaxID=206335 RepID=A0A9P5U985_9AGAR|nr:hypothetical protein BDP27DRAFT_1220279 [Rhodocollybia butyracea]